jgi:predicted amidohydrolase YtcJ
VVPGLIDAHVRIAELGAVLQRVNLVGVKTEAEAVEETGWRSKRPGSRQPRQRRRDS